MGFYGLKQPSAGSNISFGFCTNVKIVTSASNVNELRGELITNGIDVQDDNGNVEHYDSFDKLFDAYPKGLIIVKECPQKIGEAELVEQIPVYDNNGFLIRYNCKYNCKLCENVQGCGSMFCIGFSRTIIGCKQEDGTCKYYSTDGSVVDEDTVSRLNCECEDPIWVLEKNGDNIVVKSYSRVTGKECSSGELLINKNTISCGKEVLLHDGINFLTDETGSGVILRVDPIDLDKYNDCNVFSLFVNDNLVFSDTILAVKEHPPLIDITPYNVFWTYKIEYKVE